MNPYEILGIDKDASPADIKAAYRKKAKETHSDLTKGDDDDFLKVKLAYDTLINSAKRERYDLHGVMDNRNGAISSKALEEIHNMMMQIVMQADAAKIKENDIIKLMRNKLEEAITQHQSMLKSIKERIDNYEQYDALIKSNLKANKGTESIFPGIMGKIRDRLDEDYRKVYEALSIFITADDILKHYKFKAVRPEYVTVNIYSSGTTA